MIHSKAIRVLSSPRHRIIRYTNTEASAAVYPGSYDDEICDTRVTRGPHYSCGQKILRKQFNYSTYQYFVVKSYHIQYSTVLKSVSLLYCTVRSQGAAALPRTPPGKPPGRATPSIQGAVTTPNQRSD